MIDTKNYDIIDDNCGEGYESKDEAYREIKECYAGISGITTFCDAGRWYIVLSKTLRNM